MLGQHPSSILWCDAEANCRTLSSREGVRSVLSKAKEAGIDTVVVDVKPLSGEVLYMSTRAPRLGKVKGFEYPADFDLLQAMIQEGRATGISIHANLNIFSEGHRHWKRGPAYLHPEWQVISYEPRGLTLAQDSIYSTFGLFVNPIGPAREYELAIISEVISHYDVEGIVFDRMRYPNLYADFSEETRIAFQELLGCTRINWPYDVFRHSDDGIKEGRFYKEYLEWRAWQIKNFATEACGLVRSIRPNTQVGVYVGSWYDTYYNEGVNWGSSTYHAGYPWMTPSYNETGYAELFDYICAGCYYPYVRIEDACAAGKSPGHSVEAGCDMSMNAVRHASKVYGSLYLLDYKDDAVRFAQAVDMARSKTDGVMLFDLVYVEMYDWWSLLKTILR